MNHDEVIHVEREAGWLIVTRRDADGVEYTELIPPVEDGEGEEAEE